MLILLVAMASAGEPLTMQVNGLTSLEGTVICTLYQDPASWMKTSGHAGLVKAASADGAATCVFPDVAPGTYAAVFLHDLDGDGDLNTNWLGMPTEPWGVSNNAPMRFGPPSFLEASFSHPGGQVLATVK